MSHLVDIESTSFADHTTLRTGGTVDSWIVARTEEACIEAVIECDDLGRALLVVGGGSNLVCSDDHFEGTVVQIACPGLRTEQRDGVVHMTVGAGEDWYDLVQLSLEAGSGFLAPLSGIPGLVGATPIQNVGAYGTDVGAVISSVRVWDRIERRVRSIAGSDCGFEYRSSIFKADVDRYVILEVEFVLPLDAGVVIGYQQLADYLGVDLGDVVDGAIVRDAVLSLRRTKGMVLDDSDHDTWSVGSFFVNPVLDPSAAVALPAACPRYEGERGVKVSAAYLIESCGIEPGFQLPGSRARVSSKHTLALCNSGGASTDEVVSLGREIRNRVRDNFGIELQHEPRFVGVRL